MTTARRISIFLGISKLRGDSTTPNCCTRTPRSLKCTHESPRHQSVRYIHPVTEPDMHVSNSWPATHVYLVGCISVQLPPEVSWFITRPTPGSDLRSSWQQLRRYNYWIECLLA
ncbi:hypothetical protein BgiBS90_001420, partial [Biomphalaria glabrata]